jgi:hypothetical protein
MMRKRVFRFGTLRLIGENLFLQLSLVEDEFIT